MALRPSTSKCFLTKAKNSHTIASFKQCSFSYGKHSDLVWAKKILATQRQGKRKPHAIKVTFQFSCYHQPYAKRTPISTQNMQQISSYILEQKFQKIRLFETSKKWTAQCTIFSTHSVVQDQIHLCSSYLVFLRTQKLITHCHYAPYGKTRSV